MSDTTLTLALVAAFAAIVSVHVATLFGLARRHHLALAFGGLVLPPLAPYWAFTRGMRARSVAWIGAAALYVVVLLLAR